MFPYTDKPRKRPVRAGLAATALAALGLSLPMAAEAQQVVTVTINHFLQGQDPDGTQVVDAIDAADVIGDGDYYAQVRIGDAPFQRNRGSFEEAREIRPFWQFREVVDQPGIVPVVIQIWDADPIENNDDIIDINPEDNSQELVLTLDLATCTWEGDAGPNGTTSSGDGDIGHTGILEGGHRGHVFFGVACSDGDFDDDGIPDAIERFGIFERRNDAWELAEDLRITGADPCRKTIMVEVDAVLNAVPAPGAENLLRAAFDAAPVDAPTGDCPYPEFAPKQDGIDLVIDFSHLLLPPTFIDGNGNFSLQDVGRYKTTAFDPVREPYFHYALWVPSVAGAAGWCCDGDRNTDFIAQPLGSARADAALFMHELGHALGFGHHGRGNIDRDDAGTPVARNCKPNYPSVMNYIYPNGLIDTATGDPVLDYSHGDMQTLDEDALSEQVPLSDSTLQVCWSPFLGLRRCAPANGQINWNGNRTNGLSGAEIFDPGTVAADITTRAQRECNWEDTNNDGIQQVNELTPLSNPGDVLADFDDWSNLTYRGPLTDLAGGSFGEDFTEMTVEEILANEAEMQLRLRCNPPDSGEWLVDSSCTIWRDAAATGDMRIAADVVLTVAPDVRLNLDLSNHALRIGPGGRLELAPGARVN